MTTPEEKLETPRTEAQLHGNGMVPANLARQLERELAEALDRAKKAAYANADALQGIRESASSAITGNTEPKECPACWGNGYTYGRREDEKVPCGFCGETGKVLPYHGTPSTEARMVTDAMVERALAAANDAMIDARRHWHPDDRKAVRAMLEAAINPTFANIVDAARAEADRRGTPSSTTRSEGQPYSATPPPDASVCVYTGGRCTRPWCKERRGCEAWESAHAGHDTISAIGSKDQ